MHRNDPLTPAALPRRGFLSNLGATLAGVLTLGVATRTTTASAKGGPAQVSNALSQETWLDGLDGQHGQVFEAPALNGGAALKQARNFLDVYRDVYGLESGEIDVVIGAHGSALSLFFQDQIWEKFSLGERFDVKDPRTGAAARRNVFAYREDGGLVPAQASVEALQERGVIFLLCNNALNGLAGRLAQAGLGTQEAVRADILAALLPEAKVVPAVVVALNRAQEKGLSYIYSGG